jgi:hypothetical protein
MPGSPALFFETFPYGSVAAESFNDLFGAASQAMNAAGLTDIVKQQSDVAGRTPNSHAAIIFVGGTPHNTTAVIMVAGDDAFPVLGKLATALRNIKFL